MNRDALHASRRGAMTWFGARSSREQVLIAFGVTLAVAVLLVAGVVRPLQVARIAARNDIRAYESRTARASAAHLGVAGRTDHRSPSVVVTESAAAAGLTLQRLDPEGGRLRVVVADAPFENLMQWLDQIERDSGLAVIDAQLERRLAPGTVGAQLTLGTP